MTLSTPFIPGPPIAPVRSTLSLDQLAARLGFDADSLRDRERVPINVARRRKFAAAARARGISAVEIGRWLGIHRTSVLDYLHQPPGKWVAMEIANGPEGSL